MSGQVVGYYKFKALQNNEFSDGAYYRGRDGKMYFGGVDGFNRFDPDNIRMRSYAPPVLINSFSVRQRPLSDFRADREIVLSHGENFFSIQFSALEYIRNESCEYAYILRGFDDDWVYAGTDNTAVFTNVPPGSYEFSVRATNGDKVWGDRVASLRIRVRPPWWNTTGAYVLYLLLAAGASPIMAQALPEAEEITASSAASVLNTGTPDDEKFRLCLACGRAASALGHPTVLDPVGIGASRWRLQSIQGMLHLFTPSILRVNLGEARALLQLEGVNDMDAARALRGQVFYFDRNDATLPAGRWYVADLIGCEVRDADTGRVYGVVTSVDHPGAQDIYTVKAPSGKEYMFPGVDAFLKERNPPEGYLLVTPIPGLLDDDFDSEREEE